MNEHFTYTPNPPEEVQPPHDLLFDQIRELKMLNSKDERICGLICRLEMQLFHEMIDNEIMIRERRLK